MTSYDKTTKPKPTPKVDTPPKDKSPQETATSPADGGEKGAASPSSYSRGEGHKPVSQAYKDNWNLIFAKKKKR